MITIGAVWEIRNGSWKLVEFRALFEESNRLMIIKIAGISYCMA